MLRTDWERVNGHKGGVFWFTGLSGAGKSTISQQVELELYKRSIRSVVIDGDQLRHGLNADLGFSEQDRAENMRRAAEMATMFLNKGFVVIVAMISPSSVARQGIRQHFQLNDYREVYVECSLDICEERDPKGLYQKARTGEIREFTGIDAMYEPPDTPELIINTENSDLKECTNELVAYILQCIFL